MDREIWRIVSGCVARAARAVKTVGRKPTFSEVLIVRMYFWAVWHHQSLSWACDRLHYNTLFRPRALPSISQFSRRVKTERFTAILQRVHKDLAARGIVGSLGYIDGKPLPVSPVSKDPDARSGHITGGYAKGYKLHAYVNEARRVQVWVLAPLNVDEKVIARELLLPNLPPPAHCQTLDMGDKNYDARVLYDGFAAKGRSLLTPLRAQNLVGPDGHSQSTEEHGTNPARGTGGLDDPPGSDWLCTAAAEQRRGHLLGAGSCLRAWSPAGVRPPHRACAEVGRCYDYPLPCQTLGTGAGCRLRGFMQNRVK